ncbi:hypothetical protein U9M48_044157 [Paspalum notatum var. saurae]|uniref:Uncharacterized protein n=1 Tax=Paspalum notatum var. saurae TaxID=547442 RepID=A0AAQ3XGC5_PASNO
MAMAMAAADATTAMTIGFLRARLLSERSVSRAAKERADHLARRVAELEEQLRTVTAQRRKAERAAAEVLAILDSQGFGRLSDAAGDSGSGSDGEAGAGGPDADAAERGRGGGNAAEDALSGSELGALAAAAEAGGLSWKGRAASPDCERRRRSSAPPPPQHKGRQPRQRHGHGHRRGYFYARASDSLPKYHPGQSCRKIRRKELRSQAEDEEGEGNAAESTDDYGQAERSHCTVCTDEQPGFDGEASQGGCGSSGNGELEDRGADDRYATVYEKEGEMEKVLEKQAALIGQFEAEENAQREWEKKFSKGQDSTVDNNVNLNNKLSEAENACGRRVTAQVVDKEVVCEHDNNIHGFNNHCEYLPKGSDSGLPPNVAKDGAIEQCKVDGPDHGFGLTTLTVTSSHGELQVRKDVWTTKSYPEGSGNNLGKSTPSPPGSCDSSLNAGHKKGQGDENSDSGSSYNANARSSERYANTSSVGSPLSDTPKSEVSEWSSSCFHNHTDNQLDTQLHQPSSDDVEGVIEALQRAKMSLRAKLSRPSPPSQNILALPAPDDLPVNDMKLSLTPLSRETSALSTLNYFDRDLLREDVKVPIGPAGLFRLPTDSFPRNEAASSDGYGSRFNLTPPRPPYISLSYHDNYFMPNSSFSQHGSGWSLDPYYDESRSSMLPSMPIADWHSVPVSDFRIGDGSFLLEVPRPGNDFRRVVPSGDAGTNFKFGHG